MVALAPVGTCGQQPGHGCGRELSQGRLALSEVIVQKRQLVTVLDDAEEWSKDHNASTLEKTE